jgi:hypothetical protein
VCRQFLTGLEARTQARCPGLVQGTGLANRFVGSALDPSMGFRFGPHVQNIGVGDLLVFTLFVLAAYRGHGRLAAGLRGSRRH